MSWPAPDMVLLRPQGRNVKPICAKNIYIFIFLHYTGGSRLSRTAVKPDSRLARNFFCQISLSN